MSTTSRCPSCRHFVYFDALVCPSCGTELGFNLIERGFVGIHNDRAVVDGVTYYTCSQRE